MKLLRQEAELSSREVAEALQIIPASLRNIEHDHNEPGLRVARRISEYFELPLESIFSENPLPPLSIALCPCSHSRAMAAQGADSHGEEEQHS